MVSAFKQAILGDSFSAEGIENTRQFAAASETLDRPSRVQVITLAALADIQDSAPRRFENSLICPLTLNVHDWLPFSHQNLYRACRDVSGMRSQLKSWQYAVGVGDLWLPIVLTAKGPLYSEVIGSDNSLISQEAPLLPKYVQPVHLTDKWRQPLYELGFRLLKFIKASPAVYLMQVGIRNETLCFDRLFPFPAAPAIASLSAQTPDLFTCHWRCLTYKPIYDLKIK